MLNSEIGENLAEGIVFEKHEGFSETQPEYTLKLNGIKKIKYIEIAERISEGQRVSNFAVFTKNRDGFWDKATQGTTIGSRKIIKIDPTETEEIKIRIMASRYAPDIEWIKVY